MISQYFPFLTFVLANYVLLKMEVVDPNLSHCYLDDHGCFQDHWVHPLPGKFQGFAGQATDLHQVTRLEPVLLFSQKQRGWAG